MMKLWPMLTVFVTIRRQCTHTNNRDCAIHKLMQSFSSNLALSLSYSNILHQKLTKAWLETDFMFMIYLHAALEQKIVQEHHKQEDRTDES